MPDFSIVDTHLHVWDQTRLKYSAFDDSPLNERLRGSLYGKRRHRGWSMIRTFLFGLIAGFAALFAVLWIVASRLPH